VVIHFLLFFFGIYRVLSGNVYIVLATRSLIGSWNKKNGYRDLCLKLVEKIPVYVESVRFSWSTVSLANNQKTLFFFSKRYRTFKRDRWMIFYDLSRYAPILVQIRTNIGSTILYKITNNSFLILYAILSWNTFIRSWYPYFNKYFHLKNKNLSSIKNFWIQWCSSVTKKEQWYVNVIIMF